MQPPKTVGVSQRLVVAGGLNLDIRRKKWNEDWQVKVWLLILLWCCGFPVMLAENSRPLTTFISCSLVPCCWFRHSNFLPPIMVGVNTTSGKVAVFNMRQHLQIAHRTNFQNHSTQPPSHPKKTPPPTRPSQKEKTLTIDADCPSDSARCRADIRRPRRPAWAHTAPAPPPSSGRVATMALPEGRKTCCRGRRGCRPKPGQR